MKKYLRVWWLLTINSVQTVLAERFGVVIFVFGKTLRFALYLAFIYFLFSGTQKLAGYTRYQALLFLLSFTLLGSVGQMLFREVYRFRGRVIKGEFDFDLLRPVHPLLRNLAGGFDVLDLITIPLFGLALIWALNQISYTLPALIAYLLLLLNSLAVIGAIHILVAALIMQSTEVDQAIMIYRDIETMGRFPVDIYPGLLGFVLTYILPVGVMFTVPVKVLLGLAGPGAVIATILVGGSAVWLSVRLWQFSVRRYSSAS